MDRGAWRAAVHGIARVGYDLVTLPSPPISRQTWGLECVVPSGRGSDSTALSHGTRPPTAQGRGNALLMGPGGLCQASGLDALPPPGAASAAEADPMCLLCVALSRAWCLFPGDLGTTQCQGQDRSNFCSWQQMTGATF